MIDIEVEARKSKTPVAESSKSRYLLIGDFGGRATADPPAVDRDNVDAVLERLDVNLAGLRMREVEDFHPDRLYARMDEFRKLDKAEPEAPSRPS